MIMIIIIVIIIENKYTFSFTMQVDKASSDEELSLLASDATLVDGLHNAGWFHYLTMANKGLAMQTYVQFYVLKKRKEPLDQLCKGLENLGILSLIRGNPSLMKSYFIVCEVPLTSKDILESFSYYMASEPVDEKSQSADSFMRQAVMKLEEGTVKMTFHNTLEHFVDATYIFAVTLFTKENSGIIQYGNVA